ncbi:MAG: ATPase [Candidatus Liptonbacteria bacterium CG11_big_fil_rev_8_21_14_0_20_35_14]|uniref:ATPase n=1 Tax=Candidatus Liptonbacteria bacterium CG11_big_fil_rev_8_21_14_0_20_35_14 TaxID=1974634 RepID=A0A2H0N6W9_9BACT|nr:MAG: ATPase [Candidatus Liptonbacteria bacterium CG11_big_fil_rev_8_21_14_0_20_35_14]
MKIVRADGSTQEFKSYKLKNSLERSGASQSLASQITKEIALNLKPGDTTLAIYNKAFKLLKSYEKPVASRYSLKQAIMALGPTGYPFEQLVGRLFEYQGFKVTYPDFMMGRCVGHEIDVLALKDGQRLAIEAKFHNQPGVKSDVKTALYIKARCDDLREAPNGKNIECVIVTNTKFTKDAEQYAECAKVRLIGWGYPKGLGIEKMLEESGIMPITVLISLNKKEKDLLLQNNIVVCGDILKNTKILQSFGISGGKIKSCVDEIDKILSI